MQIINTAFIQACLWVGWVNVAGVNFFDIFPLLYPLLLPTAATPPSFSAYCRHTPPSQHVTAETTTTTPEKLYYKKIYTNAYAYTGNVNPTNQPTHKQAWIKAVFIFCTNSYYYTFMIQKGCHILLMVDSIVLVLFQRVPLCTALHKKTLKYTRKISLYKTKQNHDHLFQPQSSVVSTFQHGGREKKNNS